MAYIYDLTDTWNAGGTTFNAIKMNVTDSASAAGSKLVTLQTNGTEHFSVTKAGVGYFSGNVGIGTASPSSKLTVLNGDIEISTAAAGNTLLSFNGTTANLTVNSSSAPLVFGTSSTERMRITSAGNVGIGTSSPQRPLHVAYLSATVGAYTAVLQGQTGGYGAGVSFQSQLTGGGLAEMGRITADGESAWNTTASTQYAGLRFYTATAGTLSEKMRLNGDGNVGIGTTAPISGVGLTIGNDGNGSATVKLSFSTSATERAFISMAGGSGEMRYSAGYGGYGGFSTFYTAGSERARIDTSGNLLVGKTSAGVAVGGELQANGSVWSVMAASTAATSTLNVYSSGAAAYRFYVDMAGTIFATNTSISAISDQRLKENVRDLDAGLDAILALKPRRFDWKQGKGKNIKDDMGFIAQEVEEVLPELIGGWKAGEAEPSDLKSVKAGDLIPVLVKAIQELTARVAQLEGN